jgi:hypothetical protein
MSFTDGKRFVATEEQTKMGWGDGGFNCRLCDKKFKAGDGVRFVYMNNRPGCGSGNLLVCDDCDGPDVADRAESDFNEVHNGAKRWNIHFSQHREFP